MRTECEQCRRVFECPDNYAGCVITCPLCGKTVTAAAMDRGGARLTTLLVGLLLGIAIASISFCLIRGSDQSPPQVLATTPPQVAADAESPVSPASPHYLATEATATSQPARNRVAVEMKQYPLRTETLPREPEPPVDTRRREIATAVAKCQQARSLEDFDQITASYPLDSPLLPIVADQRRRWYLGQHPQLAPSIASAVADGCLQAGLPQECVHAMFGKPDSVSARRIRGSMSATRIVAPKLIETWYYDNGISVGFEDKRVQAWSK